MSNDYTFWHMLKDMLFNGGKVSGNDQKEEGSYSESWGGLYSDNPSSGSSSREFDPSEDAGAAFRSVFGDDN